MMSCDIGTPYTADFISAERAQLEAEIEKYSRRHARITDFCKGFRRTELACIMAVSLVLVALHSNTVFNWWAALLSGLPLLGAPIATLFRGRDNSEEVLVSECIGFFLLFILALAEAPEPSVPVSQSLFLFGMIVIMVIVQGVADVKLDHIRWDKCSTKECLDGYGFINHLEWCERFLEWATAYPAVREYLGAVADQGRFATVSEAKTVAAWVEAKKGDEAAAAKAKATQDACVNLGKVLASSSAA